MDNRPIEYNMLGIYQRCQTALWTNEIVSATFTDRIGVTKDQLLSPIFELPLRIVAQANNIDHDSWLPICGPRKCVTEVPPPDTPYPYLVAGLRLGRLGRCPLSGETLTPLGALDHFILAIDRDEVRVEHMCAQHGATATELVVALRSIGERSSSIADILSWRCSHCWK